MDLLYHACNVAQKGTLRAFADWKVTGRENVPSIGPLIVVANHQSNFDPPLLSPSIPRRIRFLAKDNIFKGPAIANWFLREYGAFPLKRTGIDVTAHRWALDQLRRDQVIAVFPEGTRSRGGMKRARPGVVRLALTTQATILPVGITGTERLGTWMRVFNPTGRITVTIGRPFTLPVIEGKPSPAVIESMADMVMRKVADLLPSSYRGVYGEPVRPLPPEETFEQPAIARAYSRRSCGGRNPEGRGEGSSPRRPCVTQRSPEGED